jgi:ABC-type dipeptide/oligopeptide/nickel transport system ATPase component
MTNRYLRSVNIAHDLSAGGYELAGYMATPLVMQTLDRIMQGVRDARQGRAFSIIGPYGTGKSAFGVFLAHWVERDAVGRIGLQQQHMTAREIDTDGARLLAIPLSVKATTLRQAIAATVALKLAQVTNDEVLPVIDGLHRAAEDVDVPPEQIAVLLSDAANAIKKYGYSGFMLVIDELGQHLAQIHRSGDSRDLFVLQTLAEMAARSGETPVVIVTILHQTFERYSTTASVAQQTEWAKVQGRYVDLVFQEPQSQMMRFVASVVQSLRATTRVPRKELKALADEASRLGLRPAEISNAEWAQLVAQSYPLHPTVLIALPMLFRTLAQNERSLFAFLTAQERGSFAEFVQQQPDHPYRLSDLFIYIEQTLGPGLFGRARGRPWLELSEVCHRLRNDDRVRLNLIKTIGVLAALNDDRLLRPSRELVIWAMADTVVDATADDALRALQQQQVLVYSAYRDRWRLAEASDLNIDDKFQFARTEFVAQRDVVPLLTTYASLQPITAYRHSYYSGTLRTFVVRFVDAHLATAQHSTAQHSTAQHSTAQHSTAQHSTARGW